jgi:hypothetical protein
MDHRYKLLTFELKVCEFVLGWHLQHNDTQINDIQYNETQNNITHNDEKWDSRHNELNADAECRLCWVLLILIVANAGWYKCSLFW